MHACLPNRNSKLGLFREVSLICSYAILVCALVMLFMVLDQLEWLTAYNRHVRYLLRSLDCVGISSSVVLLPQRKPDCAAGKYTLCFKVHYFIELKVLRTKLLRTRK